MEKQRERERERERKREHAETSATGKARRDGEKGSRRENSKSRAFAGRAARATRYRVLAKHAGRDARRWLAGARRGARGLSSRVRDERARE